jgi:hypothetical protein
VRSIVRRYKGTRFEELWDADGEVAGIRFAIRSPEGAEGPVKLEVPITGIVDELKAAGKFARVKPDGERQSRLRQQARRIAWRHMKDFVEQALLAAHVGLFDVFDVFLTHVEVEGADGESTTLGDELREMLVLRTGETPRLLPPPRRLLPGAGKSSPST